MAIWDCDAVCERGDEYVLAVKERIPPVDRMTEPACLSLLPRSFYFI